MYEVNDDASRRQLVLAQRLSIFCSFFSKALVKSDRRGCMATRTRRDGSYLFWEPSVLVYPGGPPGVAIHHHHHHRTLCSPSQNGKNKLQAVHQEPTYFRPIVRHTTATAPAISVTPLALDTIHSVRSAFHRELSGHSVTTRAKPVKTVNRHESLQSTVVPLQNDKTLPGEKAEYRATPYK